MHSPGFTVERIAATMAALTYFEIITIDTREATNSDFGAAAEYPIE